MADSSKSGPVPVGKMVLFRGADAPTLEESGMVVERGFAQEGSQEELWPEAYGEGTLNVRSEATVPFRQDAPDGLSLVSLDFGPGFLLPRHSHSSDCLYYITEGSIEMGSRVLGPGDGFFVPADQPYAYAAGPDGVKLLEFRNRCAFDTQFRETDMAHYRERFVASLMISRQSRGDSRLG